jgi:hypothetical protein
MGDFIATMTGKETSTQRKQREANATKARVEQNRADAQAQSDRSVQEAQQSNGTPKGQSSEGFAQGGPENKKPSFLDNLNQFRRDLQGFQSDLQEKTGVTKLKEDTGAMIGDGTEALFGAPVRKSRKDGWTPSQPVVQQYQQTIAQLRGAK